MHQLKLTLFHAPLRQWISWSLLVFINSVVIANDNETLRVFIFAGQSNMVGSDSKVEDIQQFPPYAGLEDAQSNTLFSYCIGRENKTISNGWVPLQPVNNIVGPELSFARRVQQSIAAPIAIIKVAAGGTHLGGDWNPDEPSGFEMYPLALDFIQNALEDLERKGIEYRLEGFVWHQGENDMFNADYMDNYGANLKNFLTSWRRDLRSPDLRFYIGELCTKTIWGMDLRPRMYAISLGQKEVTGEDPRADYVPTSHVGVEIGGGVGLHYHYGTLGQLEHGINYAEAYLRNVNELTPVDRKLATWPYDDGSMIQLFVLAGHRNMEGERAFRQQLVESKRGAVMSEDRLDIAYRYSLGGGYRSANDWEPLGLVDYYDTFGPEISFASTLRSKNISNIAIVKFTHSGSQIIDWTPEGSEAKSRNLFNQFIGFIRTAISDLESKGHTVELAGVFYHIGENDMSWGPFRQGAPERIMSLVNQSRVELEMPSLKWFVSQQPPTDDQSVNQIDVDAMLKQRFDQDEHLVHLRISDLPPQEKQLVINTDGIIALGDQLAEAYVELNAKK